MRRLDDELAVAIVVARGLQARAVEALHFHDSVLQIVEEPLDLGAVLAVVRVDEGHEVGERDAAAAEPGLACLLYTSDAADE